MNDDKLVSKCNKLARKLAAADGWNVPKEHSFFLRQDPRSQGYWRRAVIATEFWRKCDMSGAVDTVLEAFEQLEAP